MSQRGKHSWWRTGENPWAKGISGIDCTYCTREARGFLLAVARLLGLYVLVPVSITLYSTFICATLPDREWPQRRIFLDIYLRRSLYPLHELMRLENFYEHMPDASQRQNEKYYKKSSQRVFDYKL
jgi:hypothetical protein